MIHALLVGINHYDQKDSIRPLEFAVADVTSVRDWLTGKMAAPAANIRLLTNPADATGAVPDRRMVLQALDSLTKIPMTPDDTFVLYWAAHGYQFGDGTYCLATTDCNNQSDLLLRDTALPLDTLRQYIGRIQAGQQVLILDTCRDNPTVGMRGGARRMDHPIARNIEGLAGVEGAPQRRLAILSACWEGCVSWEYPQGRHSWFLWNLLRCLEDTGADVDVVDLKERAALRMKEGAHHLLPHASEQSPHLILDGGRVVLTSVAPRAKQTSSAVDLLASAVRALHEEHYDEALTLGELAAMRAPRDPVVIEFLARVRKRKSLAEWRGKAEAAEKAGDLDKAANCWDEAARADPSEPGFRARAESLRKRAKAKQESDAQAARAELDRLRQSADELAKKRWYQCDHERVEAAIRIAQDPRDIAALKYASAADELAEKKEYQAAYERVEAAIRIAQDPRDIAALKHASAFYCAMAEFGQAHFIEAERSLRESRGFAESAGIEWGSEKQKYQSIFALLAAGSRLLSGASPDASAGEKWVQARELAEYTNLADGIKKLIVELAEDLRKSLMSEPFQPCKRALYLVVRTPVLQKSDIDRVDLRVLYLFLLATPSLLAFGMAFALTNLVPPRHNWSPLVSLAAWVIAGVWLYLFHGVCCSRANVLRLQALTGLAVGIATGACWAIGEPWGPTGFSFYWLAGMGFLIVSIFLRFWHSGSPDDFGPIPLSAQFLDEPLQRALLLEGRDERREWWVSLAFFSIPICSILYVAWRKWA